MTEPERTGGKNRIKFITADEAMEIEAAGLGGPRVYYEEGSGGDAQVCFFADAAELERWRASRINSQAGNAHG